MFETKKAGYDALFLCCAAVFVFIGFVSLFIDATKQIGVQDAGAPITGSGAESGIREGEPPFRPESNDRSV